MITSATTQSYVFYDNEFDEFNELDIAIGAKCGTTM